MCNGAFLEVPLSVREDTTTRLGGVVHVVVTDNQTGVHTIGTTIITVNSAALLLSGTN